MTMRHVDLRPFFEMSDLTNDQETVRQEEQLRAQVEKQKL